MEQGQTMTYDYIDWAVLTDIGRKRKNNEDSYQTLPEQGVFVVADGMGGAEEGEVASQAVVDGVLSTLAAQKRDDGKPLSLRTRCGLVQKAIDEASFWIFERASRRGTSGTGSTIVSILFDAGNPARAVALHAGDSRLYRLRGRKLKTITRDHTVAMAAGARSEKNLPKIFHGIITQAVGVKPSVTLERTEIDVKEGDVFLLCSDGLSGLVEERPMAQILRRAASEPLDNITRALIDAANAGGGKDNITACVMRIKAMPPAVATVDVDIPRDTSAGLEPEGEAATDPGTPTDGHGPTSTGRGLSDSTDVIEADTADTGGGKPTDELPRSASPARARRLLLIGGGVLLALGVVAAIVVATRPPKAEADRPDHSPDGSPPPATNEVLSAVAVSLPPAAEAVPPIQVTYRREGSDAWLTPAATTMHVAPGIYEVRRARMDYTPLIERFDAASGQTNWAHRAAWIPSPALQRLLDAEAAVKKRDVTALERLVKQDSAGILRWPDHRQRWKQVLAAQPGSTPGEF